MTKYSFTMHNADMNKLAAMAEGPIKGFIDAIELKSLVPFVGAGVSASVFPESGDRSNDDYRTMLAHAHAALDAIAQKHPATVSFIEALRNHCLNEKRRGLRPVDENGDPLAPAHDADSRYIDADHAYAAYLHADHMKELRVSLTRLILALTELYKRNAPNYYFWGDDRGIPVKDREPEFDKQAATVRKCLQKSVNCITELEKRAPPGEKSHLTIPAQILRGMESEYCCRYDTAGRKRYSRFGRPSSEPAKLDPDHIAWLTDLLWTTISMWLPIYPTSHDLAIELSLISEAWTRTSEPNLSKNAEGICQPATLSRFIENRFRRYWPTAVGGTKLLISKAHHDIARWAIFMSADGGQIHNPVVFSTNFDCGLELAIEERIRKHVSLRKLNPDSRAVDIRAYRVVFPVLMKERPKGNRGKGNEIRASDKGGGAPDGLWYLVWVARDWHLKEGQEIPEIEHRWILEGKIGRHPLEDLLGELKFGGDDGALLRPSGADLQLLAGHGGGPIVVKLHGSPMHVCEMIPEPTSGKDDDRKYRWRTDWKKDEFLSYLVLANHQFVDSILNQEATFPYWMRPVGASAKPFMGFLGYSVSDWNMRFQIAKDTHKLSGGEAATGILNRGMVYLEDMSQPDAMLLTRYGLEIRTRELAHLADEVEQQVEDFRNLVP